MSTVPLVKEGREQFWTEATLSSSLSSSCEDVDERNGGYLTSDLSSFILVSEGNSVEIPPSSTILDLKHNVCCSSNGPSHDKQGTSKLGDSSPSIEVRKSSNSPIECTVAKVAQAPVQQVCSSSHKKEYDKSGLSGSRASNGLDIQAGSTAALSGSTVFVEPFVPQSEAILAKNTNRDLKLKVSKLTTILDQKTAEIEMVKHSISELQGKLLAMSEEKRKFESVAHSKDAIIATLKLKLSEEKTIHVQKLDQSQSQKGLELEKANNELSVENKGLKKKLQQLSLENKTLFERSSVLLSQIQDSETKRAVESCERQVLEGKIDYLIQELSKMRKDLQEGKKEDCSVPRNTSPVSRQQPLTNQETMDTHTTRATAKSPTERRDELWKIKLGGASRLEQKQRPCNIGGARKWQGDFQRSRIDAVDERVGLGRSDVQQKRSALNLQRKFGSDLEARRNVAAGVASRIPVPRLSTSDRTEAGVDCPMCGKKLLGSEATIALHVEHCIQMSEMKEREDANTGDQI